MMMPSRRTTPTPNFGPAPSTRVTPSSLRAGGAGAVSAAATTIVHTVLAVTAQEYTRRRGARRLYENAHDAGRAAECRRAVLAGLDHPDARSGRAAFRGRRRRRKPDLLDAPRPQSDRGGGARVLHVLSGRDVD